MLKIPSLKPATAYSVTESRFNETWSKINIYALDQYDRIAVLDGDMLVLQNMDELMEIPIPDDVLAACHACVCNPRKLSHYPPTWYLFARPNLTPGFHPHVHTRINYIRSRSLKECRRPFLMAYLNSMEVFRSSNLPEKSLRGFLRFSIRVALKTFFSQIKAS